MTTIFISGAYRGDTISEVHDNIERARQVAERYWRDGYAVLCPHTNSGYMDGVVSDQRFLAGTLELAARCDAIAMMPGWYRSEGARAEHEQAMQRGQKIIYEQEKPTR